MNSESEKEVTLLSAAAVGKILGISVVTLWKLDKQGVLKPIKLGYRTKRYRSDEVSAYVESLSKAREVTC
jgi:predicted DNA-binding transcriptional regulator AlpA